jgi:hypothetical protein
VKCQLLSSSLTNELDLGLFNFTISFSASYLCF